MRKEDCKGCKYARLHSPWNSKFQCYGKAIRVCVCKPYWLKPVEDIKKCPKVEHGASFDSYSLICKVNTEV